MQTGFFVMKDAAQVLHYKDLSEAKAYLKQRIDEFLVEHPSTEKKNIAKAEQMISSALSIQRLSIAVSNFVLAHTSENLKVIR
jgi:hypothetical protein